ncbi:MAG: hypothetical protein LUE98_13805 [Tannerellaceae bacterium]|nr:hypothetical protein [Tannerellaceae bacterium]
MNNNKTTGIEHYTGLFQQIIHLLGKTPEEIINSYPDHEMSLLEWPKSYGMKERLEIRFQEEQATLTCEFDKKRRSRVVNIFTDINPTAEECIRVFNQNYPYNWFFNRWKMASCYLYLKQLDEIIYFKCTL